MGCCCWRSRPRGASAPPTACCSRPSATASNLMSVVAHEIRTPLTAIKAYTETLLDSLSNPHTPRERFLGIINDECDRLTRLVSDILDLSRLEAGQRPL